jgi:hypothetical protein
MPSDASPDMLSMFPKYPVSRPSLIVGVRRLTSRNNNQADLCGQCEALARVAGVADDIVTSTHAYLTMPLIATWGIGAILSVVGLSARNPRFRASGQCGTNRSLASVYAMCSLSNADEEIPMYPRFEWITGLTGNNQVVTHPQRAFARR